MNQIVADDCVVPVCTRAGSRMIDSSVVAFGGGGAVTVIVALRVTALYVAEISDVVVVDTAVVDTTAEAVLAPPGTVTVDGTVAAVVLLLVNATTAPPVGALAVSVTVADAVAPPCTLAGLRLAELSDAAAGGDVGVQPDSTTFLGMAEPSLTSTLQSAGLV